MPHDQVGFKESVPLSVRRTVSAYDYLRISESFFRVDRSLVFPDRIIILDGSILLKGDTIIANEGIIKDYVNYKGARQTNVLDKLVTDYVSYTKTYSPLLFALLRYRAKPRYLTLSISDYKVVKDGELYIKAKIVLAPDYNTVRDSVSTKDVTLSASDYRTTYDYATAIKNTNVVALDYTAIHDSVNYAKAVRITALDKLTSDSASYIKSYTPLLFTILTYRTKPRYLILSISDYIRTYDYSTSIKSKNVIASDSLSYDNTSYTRTYSPVLFTMLTRKVKPRYLMLLISDYSIIKDNESYIKVKVVSVSDYNTIRDYRSTVVNRTIMVSDYKTIYDYGIASSSKSIYVSDYEVIYDYVPSMDPNSIRYMSFYPNPSMYGILISDYGIMYDSATAIRSYKPVVVLNIVGIKDGVSMAKRTVVVYDKLVTDNVVLNKV